MLEKTKSRVVYFYRKNESLIFQRIKMLYFLLKIWENL